MTDCWQILISVVGGGGGSNRLTFQLQQRPESTRDLARVSLFGFRSIKLVEFECFEKVGQQHRASKVGDTR